MKFDYFDMLACAFVASILGGVAAALIADMMERARRKREGEQLDYIRKAFSALIMQRTGYDQHEGTDNDVINAGERALVELDEEYNEQ